MALRKRTWAAIAAAAAVFITAGVVAATIRIRGEDPVAASAVSQTLGDAGTSAGGAASSTTTTSTDTRRSMAVPTAKPTTGPPTSSATAPCALDLSWPITSAGWLDPTDSGMSCAQMTGQWRRNEQWTGERGGTMALVSFPDGWYCTGVDYAAAPKDSSAVGSCDLGGRRFTVYRGEPGQRTLTSPAPPSDAAPTTSPPTPTPGGAVVHSDLLITPSQNIECARLDGAFHCTIKAHDFSVDPCPGQDGPLISLNATGPGRIDACAGTYFSGGVSHWPEPTPYGSTVVLGDITCDVGETGLRCTNVDGHGFSLSRAAYAPF